MPRRERPGDRGRRRANEGLARVAFDFRLGRLNSGLSLRAVAAGAGVDHAAIWRFERRHGAGLRVQDIAAICAVVGLDLVVRAYPGGDPIRDIAHARLLSRLRERLHPALAWRTEVLLTQPGDRRAWDAVIGTPTWQIGVEAETVFEDVQALERRLALKRRDGGMDHMILVVADTPRNRLALAAAPSAFGELPLRTRGALAALRAGRDPQAGGIVFL